MGLRDWLKRVTAPAVQSRRHADDLGLISSRVKLMMDKHRSAYIYGPQILASFDAAQSGGESAEHWAAADCFSADAALSLTVRKTVRERARYEVANNCYAKGIVLTWAYYIIGTGPHLQLLSSDKEFNAKGEKLWAEWMRAVRLADKLRTFAMARAVDGEAFAVHRSRTNPRTKVKLDLMLLECDRITTPWQTDPGDVDGCELDDEGNVVAYYVLRDHPGASGYLATAEYDEVSAADIYHWFRADRPEQHRGISDLMPALPLFAQLRRYTLAVADAAETAANFTAILKTDMPPGGEAEEIEPMDEIQIRRNLMVSMPGGWDVHQMEAQQPASTHREFTKTVLNEVIRCLVMPLNIALGSSEGLNYASGRLDDQAFGIARTIERTSLEEAVLDRLLGTWLAEAALVEGLNIRGEEAVNLPHDWFWDGHPHVDPVKHAAGQQIRLQNLTTNLASEYAAEGKDWEPQLEQRAREIEKCKKLGLPITTGPGQPGGPQPDEEE